MKYKKSTGTKFLEYIEINPKLRYKDMQLFFFKNKYPTRPITDMSNGFYCTNIQKLIGKGHIKKDSNKKYSLTKSGKKYQKTPYAETQQEREKYKENTIRYKAVNEYWKTERMNFQLKLKEVDARGHVETVSELIALLNEFPGHLKIDVAIDPEINATGPIASTVCVDSESNMRLITLFPTHTEAV
jgi:hypothetical protein